MTPVVAFITGLAGPPVAVAFWMPLGAYLRWRAYRARYGPRNFATSWLFTAVAGGVIDVAAFHDWAVAAGSAASALLAAGSAWWFRRRPRRFPALLGAKARARRDAMVRTMRERRVPVLRPVGGRA